MQKLSAYIVGLSSLSFMFAFVFEDKTDLAANFAANSALMEERVRINQTSFDGVNEAAVEKNMAAIRNFSDTVEREYSMYGCGPKTCR